MCNETPFTVEKIPPRVRNELGPLDQYSMDDLRFYVLFNSISVISERCMDDNEQLRAMELRLRLKRFHLE